MRVHVIVSETFTNQEIASKHFDMDSCASHQMLFYKILGFAVAITSHNPGTHIKTSMFISQAPTHADPEEAPRELLWESRSYQSSTRDDKLTITGVSKLEEITKDIFV